MLHHYILQRGLGASKCLGISLTLGTVTKLQIAVIRWNMETIIWVASSLDSEQNIGMITVVCPKRAKVLLFFGGSWKSTPTLLMMMEAETRLTYELPDDGRLKVTMLHFHDGGKINSSVIRGAKTSCNLMPLREDKSHCWFSPSFCSNLMLFSLWILSIVAEKSTCDLWGVFLETCRESYLPSARVTFQRKSTICTSQKKFAPRTDQACCHTQLYASGIKYTKIHKYIL